MHQTTLLRLERTHSTINCSLESAISECAVPLTYESNYCLDNLDQFLYLYETVDWALRLILVHLEGN